MIGYPLYYIVKRKLSNNYSIRFQITPSVKNTKELSPFINFSKVSYSLGIERRKQLNKITLYGAIQGNLYHERIRIDPTDKDFFVVYPGKGIRIFGDDNVKTGAKSDFYEVATSGIIGLDYSINKVLFIGLDSRASFYNFYNKRETVYTYFPKYKFAITPLYGIYLGYKF